ncbi:MAG TPA: TonB family protein [Bryobacteraceae bacterium]|nr:TonB family protein [Bryobacteraceae bacterium]
MFQLLQRSMAARWRWALAASVAVHLLAVCLMLRQPAPVFVRPQAVVAGAGGTSVTALYLPYDRGVHSEPATEARVPLSLSKAKSKALRRKRNTRKAPLKADQAQPGDTLQTARAGSPYGSLAEGPADGSEIRPALPVTFVNPDISRSELPPGVQGDVVVEVTIDARGNIVEKRILQRLGYGIDEKVLAALEGWRFTPATQDGVPIPSQHDIHFHFPN